MSNANFHNANKAKNDEFYTQRSDIEKEVGEYEDHFKGKVVFLNCDDPEESKFWVYFSLTFEFFGLKKLVATHYNKEGKPSYKLERTEGMTPEMCKEGEYTQNVSRIQLNGDGDFRSDECIEILKEADIVVTNPPFSLFREYVAQLMEYDKKFLIVGNSNAITYKEVFKYIKESRVWLGCTSPKEFVQPDGSVKKFGNITWFTNLEHKKRNEEIILYRTYNEKDYPKYDNYDAIEVSKTKDIPKDFEGVMGVPISFLGKYNPEQFEICGTQRWFYDTSLGITNGKTLINSKETYDRIFIRNRNPQSPSV